MNVRSEPSRSDIITTFRCTYNGEEIFRADRSDAAESGNQSQNGGNQATRLAELQKQIVVATWKLQRDKQGPPKK